MVGTDDTYNSYLPIVKCFAKNYVRLTGPHAFGPKYVYIGHKILMKQPHDCSYY